MIPKFSSSPPCRVDQWEWRISFHGPPGEEPEKRGSQVRGATLGTDDRDLGEDPKVMQKPKRVSNSKGPLMVV